MINLQVIKDLFTAFDIKLGEEVPLDQYVKFLDRCKAEHGTTFATWVQDWFMPLGGAFNPGSEDSNRFYLCECECWEDMERALEEYSVIEESLR